MGGVLVRELLSNTPPCLLMNFLTVCLSCLLCRSVCVQVPTLGSQEGAFENVRMNYSGDQGQTIRQLISAHVLRRVAMCVLSSPHGRRQHLAVSHEKGKVCTTEVICHYGETWLCCKSVAASLM